MQFGIQAFSQTPYDDSKAAGTDELKVVKDGSYATGKFLKLVQRPIPDYK